MSREIVASDAFGPTIQQTDLAEAGNVVTVSDNVINGRHGQFVQQQVNHRLDMFPSFAPRGDVEISLKALQKINWGSCWFLKLIIAGRHLILEVLDGVTNGLANSDSCIVFGQLPGNGKVEGLEYISDQCPLIPLLPRES